MESRGARFFFLCFPPAARLFASASNRIHMLVCEKGTCRSPTAGHLTSQSTTHRTRNREKRGVLRGRTPSDDSYFYQLSLVLATATISFLYFFLPSLDSVVCPSGPVPPLLLGRQPNRGHIGGGGWTPAKCREWFLGYSLTAYENSSRSTHQRQSTQGH